MCLIAGYIVRRRIDLAAPVMRGLHARRSDPPVNAHWSRDDAPEAVAALVKVATSGKSESARLAAASALLDRGFGKAIQAHEHGAVGPIQGEIKIILVDPSVRPREPTILEHGPIQLPRPRDDGGR
jgi:hypothetical protein